MSRANASYSSDQSPISDDALFRLLFDRYFTEGAYDPIAVVAGLIQTGLYADFGYIVSLHRASVLARVYTRVTSRLNLLMCSYYLQYVTKVLRGQKFELPA